MDVWITAADDARAATLAALSSVLECPAHAADDRALQRAARVFQTAMLSDNPDEVALLRECVASRRSAFLLSANLPDRHACNAFIGAALDVLETYLALDDAHGVSFMRNAEPLPARDLKHALSAA